MSEAHTDIQTTASKAPLHRYRHRTNGKPMTLRTQVMRHVVSFFVLFIYFLFSAWKESGVEASTSDWSVIFYVVLGAIVFGASFMLYPIVHRAWVDSKK